MNAGPTHLPLHAWHVAHNARIESFAGWAMPIHYPLGILGEHKHTRAAAGLFDVLEHIRDDARALQIVNRKLRHGGRIVLAVPAYMWLWGQQDVVNQHCRRYTQGELREKLQAANFTVERTTYFNTFLFPPIAAVRLLAHIGRREPAPDGDFTYAPSSSNAVLFNLFSSERIFLRFLDFPFGVSVFTAAQKD